MIDEAVKIDLKVMAAAAGAFAAENAIPVFHRWIREGALDELMVDVADYSHVPDGPGVLLVCHDAIYGLDTGGGELGLLYSRRRETRPGLGTIGSLDDRLASVFRRALECCDRLEREPELAGLTFPGDRFVVTVNDRRVEASAGAEALAAALGRLCSRLFPGERPVLEVGADAGGRLRASIGRAGGGGVARLLKPLAAGAAVAEERA